MAQLGLVHYTCEAWCTPIPSAMDSRVRGNDEVVAKGLIGGSPIAPARRRCTPMPSAVDSRIRGNDESRVVAPSAADSRVCGNDEYRSASPPFPGDFRSLRN